MTILGISGFENSVGFKTTQWPGLEEREYRIVQGLDSAAALYVDGRLIAAAAEERFNRKKHSGDFPAGAISYCLAEAGISLSDVDQIVHSFNYSPYQAAYSLDKVTAEMYRRVLSREALIATLRRYLGDFPAEKVRHVDHHLAHAASAFYCSGFDESLVVVADGMGEFQSVSVYHAQKSSFRKLAEISARDSIGILYSLVTLHLGFDFNSDEYKIMGLAPYGDPTRYQEFFSGAVALNPDGTISIPLLHLNRSRAERENYLATRASLEEHLVKARQPDDPILDEHRDVAAALQRCLDRVMLHICGHFGCRTGLRKLAMAGGVALNCTANGKLLRSGIFDELFVQPAAGDDGSALGAAAFASSATGNVRNERIPTPFLGPAYDSASLEKACREYHEAIDVVEFRTHEETCYEAARLIAGGKVLGWYHGRMEFGPRALGHRSILADPGHPAMRDRINSMVKMREAFRPFAPAVTLRDSGRWFDIPGGADLRYMITTVDVRPEQRSKLPAVTHVDGSARVQTVSPDDNVEFHQLLEAVGKLTGREMVLNTSFNVKGQPIVNTPEEAIGTFLNCGIDALFLNKTLVRRRHRPQVEQVATNVSLTT